MRVLRVQGWGEVGTGDGSGAAVEDQGGGVGAGFGFVVHGLCCELWEGGCQPSVFAMSDAFAGKSIEDVRAGPM